MKQIIFIVSVFALLLTLTGLSFAQQNGGSFELRSAGGTGGGGTSENGRFTLHGSVEGQDNSTLSGSDFSVEGGTWSTVCLKADQVESSSIELDNGKIKLGWLSENGSSFNIYRASNDPYFTPSSIYDTDDASPWIDDDDNSIGDPDSNQTYLIRVSNLCGESEISKRIGEFDFRIAPGN